MDDHGFLLDNAHVHGGLTWAALRWAFASFATGNWHPLTWVSHLIDVQLFGMNAGPHHVVNACLHAANGVLLFLVLRRATGNLWPSAFAGSLFVVHPLHVESVAWISERKDLLSGLFWLLTIAAYLRYAAGPSRVRYLCVVGVFALGLMAKPMAVTLPLVLLLMDWWPLGRPLPPRTGAWPSRRLLLEKAPLLVLSAALGVVTIVAQQSVGAVGSTASFPLSWRIGNALIALTHYVRDTLWPSRLAVYYPHGMGTGPIGAVLGTAAILSGVTAAAILARRPAPFFLAGWLWFLVVLLPVIGLVQVGGQARADRYLYVPLVGLGLLAAWGLAALARRVGLRRRHLAAPAVAALAACAAAASAQAEYWRTPAALYRRALEVTSDNWLANNGYAVELERQGRRAEAIVFYREAARLNPGSAAVRANLAMAHYEQREYGEATIQFRAALQLDPANGELASGLGQALGRLGRYPEALDALAMALRLQTDRADTWNALGSVYGNMGLEVKAGAAFREALRLRPDFPEARENLGRLRSRR